MSFLRLKRGRFHLRAMSKAWRMFAKSTKELHRFITLKSRKALVIRRLRRNNNHITSSSPLYLSPRRTKLERKKLYKKYKYPTQDYPIYIDNLFKTTHHYYPSSSSSLKFAVQACEKLGNDCDENVHGDGLPVRSTPPALGIDERAEEFIARFRAELNKSSWKW